jgi:hypothetical protein
VSDHLALLVQQVESSAEWRASKAEQYPNDRRNIKSSQSLTRLAEKLNALPLDDEHVTAYEEMMDRAVELENPLYDISQAHSRYIGRYGFDYLQDGNPVVFLDELTEECQGFVSAEEEQIAEAESEERYVAAKEAADEAAKEAAHEAAKEAAEEAAKEAADEAYKEAYDETYKEVYDEAYKTALIEAVEDQT